MCRFVPGPDKSPAGHPREAGVFSLFIRSVAEAGACCAGCNSAMPAPHPPGNCRSVSASPPERLASRSAGSAPERPYGSRVSSLFVWTAANDRTGCASRRVGVAFTRLSSGCPFVTASPVKRAAGVTSASANAVAPAFLCKLVKANSDVRTAGRGAGGRATGAVEEANAWYASAQNNAGADALAAGCCAAAANATDEPLACAADGANARLTSAAVRRNSAARPGRRPARWLRFNAETADNMAISGLLQSVVEQRNPATSAAT